MNRITLMIICVLFSFGISLCQNNTGKQLSKIEKEIDWVLVEGGPRGDFYISKTEVTFEQYDKFCDETGYEKADDRGWGRGNRPVINVNVSDANKFCEWLSKKTGKKIRLPEKDEWEFAARGGNKSKGYIYSGSNNLDEVGWYWENSGSKKLSGDWDYEKIVNNNCKTHEVGTKLPNELGIFDMSGNVWEWVGQEDIVRGGSWYDDDNVCEVSFYYLYYFFYYFYYYYDIVSDPDYRYYNIGFRVLREK